MSEKHNINLMQSALLPEKPFWSLAKLVSVWGIALVIVVFWAVMNSFSLKSSSQEKARLTAQSSQLQSQLSQLETELANKKPDAVLTTKLATLKLILANKEELHQQLTDSSKTSVAGFASAMTELSQLHHKGISLGKVNISNNDMTFTGVARTPEAVPAWLAGFEDSILLSGKSFINFTLNENEQKLTEFVVSSKHEIDVGEQ